MGAGGGGGEVNEPSESTDFTRLATNHPDPATSDYAFTATPTFATNARSVTAYAGGILVADSETLTTTYTASGTEYHVVRFGVHIPATGEVTVTTKIDDVTQETWTTAGEYNTTASVYNLITPSIALTSGEVLKVELSYTHATPGDDSTKMLVDFATFGNSASAPPPPSGTLIWDWDAGDISKASYDAYVTDGALFTLEANSRLTADSNANEQNLSTSPQKLNIPINYEAPEMQANGDLRCFVKSDFTASADAHCMYRLESGNFDSAWYLGPRIRFRWECTCTFATSSDWANLAWAIPFQFHPGAFPVGHGQQAPINMYVRDGATFEVQLLANTNNGADYNTDNDFTWPFSDGWHKFVVDAEWDPEGSGSFFKLTVDNVVRVNTTVPIGLTASGHDANEAYLYIAAGCYTTDTSIPASPNHPSIDHHSGKLYQI